MLCVGPMNAIGVFGLERITRLFISKLDRRVLHIPVAPISREGSVNWSSVNEDHE